MKEARRLPNGMQLPTHDETLAELSHLADTWVLPEAANAFLSGRWSAPFLWQSTSLAKLTALVMPNHEHIRSRRMTEIVKTNMRHKSDKYSTSEMIFYIEEGHENDEYPDNISINVGTNRYSLEEHTAFRDAIVQQLLMQLDGVDAQLNGDGTYTEQGDVLYIFTIDEADVVTKQYYIVKDYVFCLIQVTNLTQSESIYEAAQTIVDSFVLETED